MYGSDGFSTTAGSNTSDVKYIVYDSQFNPKKWVIYFINDGVKLNISLETIICFPYDHTIDIATNIVTPVNPIIAFTITDSNKCYTFNEEPQEGVFPAASELIIPCLHEDTLVLTNMGSVPIKYIKSGDTVFTLDNNIVDVIYNIKFMITDKFIKIEKNALDNNCPKNNLYITPAHPIYLNGIEIFAKNLVNGTTVTHIKLDKPVLYVQKIVSQY